MSLYGQDILGLADNDMNRKALAQAMGDGFSIGLFDLTFGDGVKAADEFLTAREHAGLNTPALRVHIYWNNNHMLAPEGTVKGRSILWQALSLKHPNTKFYISPSCEYKSTDAKAVAGLVEIIRHYAGNCTPVLCPAPGSVVVPGVMTEEHGNKATAGPGQIASYDGGAKGEGLFDIDSNHWIFEQNKNADIVFGWCPKFNLAESHNDKPPAIRTAAPSIGEVKGMCRLFDFAATHAPRPTPTFNAHVIPIARPLLYKSWAEDMQGQNSRDNLPMLFLNTLVERLDVLTFKGEKVTSFPLFHDRNPHSLERYYSGLGEKLFAWQLADRAVQMSGSPWVWFRAGPHYFGPVNANLRAGFYQA
jgi:hypothetical protein